MIRILLRFERKTQRKSRKARTRYKYFKDMEKKPYKDSGKFKTNPCKTKTTNLRIKQINFEFSIGKPL